MIAVDTNLLIYAHRQESRWHSDAAAILRRLAEGATPWAIPWPCIHEFLAVATHPRIFDPPSTTQEATTQLSYWTASPSVVLIGEGPGYQERLNEVLSSSKVVGPKVHDARIAAICLYHGVRELWSADRDFARFPALAVRNPLVG